MDGPTIMDKSEPVRRTGGIQAAYLFGSRQAGTARPTSDVDVAVLAGRHVGLLEEQRLAAELSSVLGAPVDVVVLDRASLELRGRVVQEGQLIFSVDDPARVRFEVRTRSEYLDFLPTLREHTRAYLERAADKGP
jgi:uncharacterized protein